MTSIVPGISEASVAATLDAIYDVAVVPGQWPVLLARLSALFRCHFADVFARTLDRTSFHGIAHGLSRPDYEDEFLATWFQRNVFGNTSPVENGADITTTRQMLAKATLLRSDIYVDYLDPRDLHEGLRFKLWAGEGWVQDISLLRSWSAGTFIQAERKAAAYLLPHLRRAVMVGRRLRTAELTGATGFDAHQAQNRPVLAVDAAGRIHRMNPAAETLLRDGTVLRQSGGLLLADRPELAAALGQATTAAARHSVTLRLHGAVLRVVPLAPDRAWHPFGIPSALVLVEQPAQDRRRTIEAVAHRVGLTSAEAGLAAHLLEGRRLAEIAAATGRSVHTIRSHLAKLMDKTGTNRQVDLVRHLEHLAAQGSPDTYQNQL